jgi:hypothetical protein
MTALLISPAVFLFLCRLHFLRRLWRLPLKNGEGFFLAQRVGPDFYRAAGAPLFRRYHASLFVPLFLDLPAVVWLVFVESYVGLTFEQLLATVATIPLYNLMVFHYSARATAVSGYQDDQRPTGVQLSMAPRRMRDYMIPAVESVIVIASLLALGMLVHSYAVSVGHGASHGSTHVFRGGLVATVWVFYWQLGVLLLKSGFVRWRMPLPLNRTEDFRRWRTAWLNYHLKIFDAVRLFSAVALLAGMTWMAYSRSWSRLVQIIILAGFVLVMLVYVVYGVREERHLAATERELRPVEMVKEFPRSPVAEGRYLAGGLLYVNRDNPGVLVRSAHGIALNLAHRATFAGVAYFTGLIALVVWIVRLAS